MSIAQALNVVSSFFLTILTKIFNIEFFDGLAFGKIALIVLVICLAFDVFLQIAGRRLNDGVSAAGSVRAEISWTEQEPYNGTRAVVPYGSTPDLKAQAAFNHFWRG